ncbi:MAG: glycosyltransferase family 2 protein [Candidatus Binataceae bacterium]
MTLVTTIIPTFRRPRMLVGAIGSVLAQTFEDLEVSVYDNASGDATAAVVQSISSRDPRVHYFCHPTRIDMMANFAYGVAHVKTPYFHIMSDDDLLLPDFFQTGVVELQRHPEAMLFVGRLILAQSNGHVFQVTGDKWREGLEYPPTTFLKMTGGHTWTSMILRRDVLNTTGPLDPKVGPAGDQDFELRVTALHPAVMSKALCAIFCLHSASNSVSDPVTPLLCGIPRIVRNVGRVIDEGVRDGLIAINVGKTMRAAMLAGLSRQLLTSALVAACRGQCESMIAAADFLAQTGQYKGRALLLRALANPALPRSLVFTACSMARVGRQVWRNHKYADLSTVVSSAFERAEVAARSPLSTGS